MEGLFGKFFCTPFKAMGMPSIKVAKTCQVTQQRPNIKYNLLNIIDKIIIRMS
jgi:hypothetical protein